MPPQALQTSLNLFFPLFCQASLLQKCMVYCVRGSMYQVHTRNCVVVIGFRVTVVSPTARKTDDEFFFFRLTGILQKIPQQPAGKT